MKVCSVFGVKNKNSTLGDSSSHIVTSAIKQFAWPVQKRVILNSVKRLTIGSLWKKAIVVISAAKKKQI